MSLAALKTNVCAGLFASALIAGAACTPAFAQTAAPKTDDSASQATATASADATDKASTEADATAERTITVAEGLEAADAAAVEEGLTVRCIDQYFSNLKDAVELANQNGGGSIVLLADTVATDDPEVAATIGFRTSIIFKSAGDEALTIYRAPGQTGPMLVITDGTINLKNVTFDGSGEEAIAPIVTISDQAIVKFNKGFSLVGNTTDGSLAKSQPASAVSISGADAGLTLKEGCTISGNTGTAEVEAALYNDGALVENEGATFEDNTVENGSTPNYAGTGKLEGEKIA